MAKRCDICNLDLQDDNSYQGHLLGKRHEKNAQQSKFIQTLVQRSIFISHIPKSIPSQNLIKFFTQFGEIAKYRFGSNHVVMEFKTRYLYFTRFTRFLLNHCNDNLLYCQFYIFQ